MSKNKDKKTKENNESPAAILGRLGGNAVVRKYGTSHMKNISKKGVEARIKNKKVEKINK